MESPHQVLGLAPGASLEEVKRAYRDKCLKVHPDVNANARPEDFVRITNAYNYLVEVDKSRRVSWTTHQGAGSHGYGYGNFSSGGGGRHFRPKQQYRFSPGVIAIIIALPLALGGIRFGFAYDRVAQSANRPYGLLNPPVNPFLSAEEARRLPVNRKKTSK